MWMRAWWNQYGGDQPTCFITVIDEDDEIRGILPLCRLGNQGWQTIGGDQVCSDHLSIMARDEDQDLVAEAIADFLVDHADDPDLGWNRLRLDGIVAGDPGIKKLLHHLQNRQAMERLQSRMSVWYKKCSEDWDSHLLTYSRKTRNRQRAIIRRFEQTDDPVAVRFPEDEDSVRKTLSNLIYLHQKHWQANGEPGSFADPGMIEFIHETAIEAFRRDQLFLPFMVRIDPATGVETIVAAQLHFVGDDQRLYCFTTCVNYEYRDLAPGKLLNGYLLHYAHEHGYAGIDFMRGDEEYKGRLKAEPLPLLIVDVFSPTLSGRLACAAYDCTSRFKQFVRQHLGRELVATLSVEEAFSDNYKLLLPNTDLALKHALDDDFDIGTIDFRIIDEEWMQPSADLAPGLEESLEAVLAGVSASDSGPVILPITMPLAGSSYSNLEV